jgi:hypothetical protein
MQLRGVIALTVAALVGCRPAEPAPPAEATALVEDRAVSREPSSVEPVTAVREKLLGSYTSPSCGARRYKRIVELTADGFRATDIPHPCPGECVVQWVVARTGSWSVDGSSVVLHVDATDDPQQQVGDTLPLPATLTTTLAGLVERGATGNCRYSR